MQSLSIHVSVGRQTLTLRGGEGVEREYPVSTSCFGLGTEPGSFKTPLGRFEVAQKIGAGVPLGTIFRSREPTGEAGQASDPEDLIQTRILWLAGLDPGNANTRERYIYIHGTNHEEEIGTPASHGCVRMRNEDVADLFERVPEGTPVSIQP
ncbi:MAG TPA: L,D-transpeptidase [Chthoniobacteraceae bacterium]|jgi:lipoprotein-anchoring transpeptidase ErfK/SrfK|nr:L,D-transpeptidase [Chthoniobacteraceae bacterium]